MKLDELWKLFPIFLVEHNYDWRCYFNEIEIQIKKLLSDHPVERISHIGSTAIAHICAKNIIDVMIEISENANMENVADVLNKNGFLIMATDARRISLNKGYTKMGFAKKVYHIHIRYIGDNDELYFRDYLNEHLEIAKKYEKLKFELCKKYKHNRDAYTDAKTDFIRKYTKKARKKYGDRYSPR